MDFDSISQDLVQALLGASAALIVGGVPGYLAYRIPRIRQWFAAKQLIIPIVVSSIISVLVAGSIGLFLRDLSRTQVHSLQEQLASMNAGLKHQLAAVNAGFTIFAGGRIDPSASTSNNCEKPVEKGKYRVEKEGDGDYRICFGDQLPEDSIILTSPVPNRADKHSNIVSAHVVNSYRSSFEVLTDLNGNAVDREFGFLVLCRDASQSALHLPTSDSSGR
jgi:hypothetical protein